jgi:uncharacterized protein YoaH (UPF0181 family)
MTIYVLKDGNKMSIRKYCQYNGFNYSGIQSRMAEGMSLEEAIKAYQEYRNRKKIMYKGQTFYSYCMKNKLDYIYIMAVFIRERKKNNDLNIEKFVDEFIAGEQYKNRRKNQIKLYYKGQPLRQYCSDNGLNYNKILLAYHRYNFRNKTKKIPCTIEELVEFFEKGTHYDKFRLD